MNAKQIQLRHVDYLEHMLDAVRLARSYTEGVSKEDFLEDKKTQQAIILNLMVIGEAATQIANDYPIFVTENPNLPWREIRGMRNRMAHGYFEINLEVVWDTVQLSLPELEQKILVIQQEIGEKPE
jgi:uncharacterized protein with HEPN domain